MNKKRIIICIILITVAIIYTNLSIYFIPTGSMYPAIKRGDYIVSINLKTINIEKNVLRNDVIVFLINEEIDEHFKSKILIKRLVGLPGDTLFYKDTILSKHFMKGATILIIPKKGEEIKMDYETYNIYKKIIPNNMFKDNSVEKGEFVKYKFHANYYYMQGDNSDRSYDSRQFGLVSENQIIGKAYLILWSKYKEQRLQFL